MASQGGKRRTKQLLLAFIVPIGKFPQDGVAQRFMLASHGPKLCHPQESLRTSINPKYACRCVQKSTRHQHPQQPTRDHWVFENMTSECISRTKATLVLGAWKTPSTPWKWQPCHKDLHFGTLSTFLRWKALNNRLWQLLCRGVDKIRHQSTAAERFFRSQTGRLQKQGIPRQIDNCRLLRAKRSVAPEEGDLRQIPQGSEAIVSRPSPKLQRHPGVHILHKAYSTTECQRDFCRPAWTASWGGLLLG